jgi:hypothetical protein
VTAIPFSNCDYSNLGVSDLCNLDDDHLPQPTKYSDQVMEEYNANKINKDPDFFVKYQSTRRTFSTQDYFVLDAKTYDAYEKDIALVEVFFRKSTVIQMGSQPRMTWVDYFSIVGGLLGLVLGMGIISFVEVIWLCLRIIARKLDKADWFP